MSPGEFGGTDRFQVQGRLGAGGFGIVYKALDRERQAVVALKALRHVAPKSLYRFKQEFRALADVSHPNLVTLYELSSEGDQWFFTMELIEGVNFLRYVRDERGEGDGGLRSRATPTSPESDSFFRGDGRDESGSASVGLMPDLNVARLRDALPQLSRGVLALHAAGKLHRDIKPSNVLVSSDGHVTLLDFGLVKELSLDQTHTMDAVGTPAYMSPEQAAGLPLAEASDWYNVGSMLYEALTGRLPFSGRPLDVLRQKQESDPPAPVELQPGIPEDLDSLCRDLLRRDPGERPSGTEVLSRLKDAGASPVAAGPAVSAQPGSGAPFVGRQREFEALWDAYRTMRRGRTVTVSVQGGSAMGKSALVRRFLEDLRESEKAVVLSGRCYERESVPYKALDSLVDALSQHLRRLPSAQAEGLLPHDIFALVRLFPVLRQVGVVARSRRPNLEIPDSQELRRRAFAALRELFVRLADRRPLVLFIDDMQWGDVDSAALLEALLRPPDPPALLLIGCYRSEEAGTSPLLRTVLPLRQNVGPALERRDIVIGELVAEEARELALALLAGEEHGTTAHAEAIARESRGNPYFIEELSRFRQSEAPPPRGQAAAAAEVTLKEVIEARVSRLSAAARRLLDVVAVAGQPIELDVAYRSADLESDGPSVLAILRVGHLVRTRTTPVRDEVETYHDRIREAVVAQLAPESLRECHQHLALALLASGRSDPEVLSAHFLGAGDARSAAEYASMAAAKASEALAFDRAATLYHFALGLRSEADRGGGELGVKLGHALASAGRGAEAAQAYLSAARGAGAAQAIDLHRRAFQQFLISGHIEEGLRILNTVLAKLGLPFPGTPRRAILSLFARRAWIRLRGLGFVERDETHVSVQELLRIDTCWSVAVGLSQVDMLRGADFQARHLLLALRAGEPYRVARALGMEVVYLALGGSRSRRRTERLLQAARVLTDRVGHPHTTALWTLIEGVTAWMDGRWTIARDRCALAETILRERCTGVGWEIISAQMFHLASLFLLGDVKELSRRLPALLKDAEERGDLLRLTFLRIGYCSHVAWLAADDPGKARQELEAGLEGWRPGKFDYLQIWARAARTDISLYSGEDPDVRERVADRWRPFARSLNRFVQVGFIRGLDSRARRRLALAAQTTKTRERDALLAGAERHAQAILRERTHWGDPFGLLVQAGAAATRRDAAGARSLLQSAEAGFTGADMALHAAVARRRRGELMGGEAGSDLVAAADVWMSEQGITNPARMTQMLAPGRWRAD